MMLAQFTKISTMICVIIVFRCLRIAEKLVDDAN